MSEVCAIYIWHVVHACLQMGHEIFTHPSVNVLFSLLNRYLVLANMLMESEVNPFDGQEAKPYDLDFRHHLHYSLISLYSSLCPSLCIS